MKTLFISRLSRKIRRYIKYCLNCQLTQIKRYRLYEKLMFIVSSLYFFHIIIINFILTLFENLNIVLTIIDKFFRRITFIIDKFIYNINQWNNILFDRLMITNWNMFIVIISNKNFKFLSNMWQFFFERLNIVLLTSTTYYFQIDKIFEKTNQIVEIIIRFFIINYSNINFVLTLSIFQIQINNFANVIIDLSTNEINYEFKIRETLSNLVIEKKIVDLLVQCLKYCRETIDITIFVNVKTKIYYDVRHVSLMFKTSDYVYLRLYHDYQLFDRFNKKINQQRCDFFFVKRRVDRLIYELNFSFV